MTINEHIGSVDRHDYFVILPHDIVRKAVSLNVGDTFIGDVYWNNDDARCFRRNEGKDLRCHYNNGDILYVKEECAFNKDSPFTCPHYYITDGVLTMDVRHDAGLLTHYPTSDMPLEACRIVLEVLGSSNGLSDNLTRSIGYKMKFKVLKNKHYQQIDNSTLKHKNNQSIIEPVKDKFNFDKMFKEARKTAAYKEEMMLSLFSDVVYEAMSNRKIDKAQLAHMTNIPYPKIVSVIEENSFFTIQELSKVAEVLKCTFNLSVSYDKENK
jgi:hypothetical protein